MLQYHVKDSLERIEFNHTHLVINEMLKYNPAELGDDNVVCVIVSKFNPTSTTNQSRFEQLTFSNDIGKAIG